MNSIALLPCAYLVDHLAGDPESFPHPVRFIGAVITKGEALLRRPNQSPACELILGSGLTAAVVGSTYIFTALTLRFAARRSATLGSMIELALAWTCIASRSLKEETISVANALACGDLCHARTRLSRIVGRDTETLDVQEISRAVIETAAESASDGIIAPLFYMALGGVPLAMAYKAVNTLDSMIGHADRNHFYFGKCAARLDDIANYVPSRMTAFAIIAVASFVEHGNSQASWRTWRRDGEKHKSPNAGQPESAMSGALQVALGGDNSYAGELVSSPRIGAEFSPATAHDAKRAIHLVSAASLIGLSVCMLVATFSWSGRRS